MRIAIASDDGQRIAQHTGRCSCFVIYDTDGGQAVRREERVNNFTAHAQGLCDDSSPDHGGEHKHQSHDSLLDNLAVWAAAKGGADGEMGEWGEKVEWDAKALKVTNLASLKTPHVADLIKPTYPEGYRLD